MILLSIQLIAVLFINSSNFIITNLFDSPFTLINNLYLRGMKLNSIVNNIKARQILTSRGHPTVEVDFITDSTIIRSSVPSGKSTGSKEAICLLDNGIHYNGKSVYNVVNNINKLEKDLLNEQFKDQKEFDNCLIQYDGTINKSRLGANLILPLSICFSKLMALKNSFPLYKHLSNEYNFKINMPCPNFNVINGGEHAGNSFSCQEIMICFKRNTFAQSLECSAVLYQSLGDIIAQRYGSIYRSVGDEGGFAPPLKNIEEGIQLIIDAANISKIMDFMIGFDFAANSFFNDGKYTFDGNNYNGKDLADYYCSLLDKYPQIYSMEDPFQEKDYESWKYFYEKAGSRINIVADDLTVTNPSMICKLVQMKMFNAVLIKPNQIGSVSETIKAIKSSKDKECKIMVSHRSAETEDTFICKLAVGVGADYIKCGAPCRGERIAKYNELLRIEESLNNQ